MLTKFKQTEISEIPEGWEELSLGDIANFRNGKSSPERNDTSNYEVFGSNGIIGYADQYNSSEGIIIVGRVGSYCGSVYFSKNKCWVTDNAIIGLPLENTDARFLYYLLLNLNLNNRRGGSGQPLLNQGILNSIEVLVPSLDEQRTIAKILSDLDDKIELNHQMNKTLESIAQAIFKRWFVDFEFPDAQGKPFKSSGGKMVDSELGEIPEGWGVSKISDLVQVLSGFAFKSSNFADGGRYRLVTIKNVQDGYFEGTTKDGLSTLPDKMPEYCKLQNGDILLSLTGNVGRICLIVGENYLLNQRVAKLSPVNKIDYGFVYLLFRQNKMLTMLENLSSGTAQQNLSPIKTAEINIIIPDRVVMEQFGKIVNPMLKMILDNLNQNIFLSQIRDSLLPRLMSGKIRV